MNDMNSIDDVAASWVAREDRAGLDPQEQVGLDAWLDADPRHRGAYVRAQAVFLHAERVRALGPGFGHSAGQLRPVARHWWLVLAAAAALLVVVLGLRPMLPGEDSREFVTGRGEVLRMTLPDGSLLTLNSDSRLQQRYQEDERRLVLLQGEALVDVVRNPARPFVVRTGQTDVVAVGTSFSFSPRLPASRRAISGSLPIRVRLSLASSASGGEFSIEMATVSVPGSTNL